MPDPAEPESTIPADPPRRAGPLEGSEKFIVVLVLLLLAVVALSIFAYWALQHTGADATLVPLLWS
jgi:hypothetical protein